MTAEERKALEAVFIEGFRNAADKIGFLRLAHVPLELADGGKLVEVQLQDRTEVGAVSPGFGSRELVYQPLPGRLARSTGELVLVYQTLEGRRALTLDQALGGELTAGPEPASERPARGHKRQHDHGHDHGHAHTHDQGHDHVRGHGHDHGDALKHGREVEPLRVDPSWRGGRD
jgi:urease accessory protein